MTLGPILPGRIPDTFSVMRTNTNLRTAAREMNRLQQQVATGQRYFYGSEAPGDAARTVQLQSLGERKAQASVNTRTGAGYLAAADDALSAVSGILVSVKQVSLASVGESATPAKAAHFVTELDTLIDGAVAAANREFRGRSVFSGSANHHAMPGGAPFAQDLNGVTYAGDDLTVRAFADLDQLAQFTVDPTAVFGTDATVRSDDLDPPLSAATRLADLNLGRGARGDALEITSNGVTARVDLATAGTLGDLKTRVEDALPGTTVTFAGGSIVVTPPAGTVEVSSVPGQRLAIDLGLSGPPAAAITGRDLDPALTPATAVADLFGGAGLASLGDNLRVTVGDRTEDLDFSGATTLQDVFNVLELAGMGLSGRVSEDGRSLEIVSRTQGVFFSIGEAGGTLAEDLGVRTYGEDTPLSSLNRGLGVPTRPGALPGTETRELAFTRRDGTTTTVDLLGAVTVGDVVAAINAADPGVLTADVTFNGNGIVVNDSSGTDDLVLEPGEVSDALGLSGRAANGALLRGRDTAPVFGEGLFSTMVQLRDAIERGDTQHVTRLGLQIDAETARFAAVRGEVGARMLTLEETADRLDREQIDIAEQLSDTFDADLAETISRLSSVQAGYEASLAVSSRLLQINLLSLL